MWAVQRRLQTSRSVLGSRSRKSVGRTPTNPVLVRRQGATMTSSSSSSSATEPLSKSILTSLRKRPLEYATIPAVAAYVGLATNWMGVKMLFYPIEYFGTEWYRPSVHSPYGFVGWQGVVPCKTERMAGRLVDIVTRRLLSLSEAFGRLDAKTVAELLQPAVEESIQNECGPVWSRLLKPCLPFILTRVVVALQGEVENVLDLRSVVLSAFVRDKEVLVELFQKVGRVELNFLVESGLGFGFVLGLLQMVAWVKAPRPWTLPVAGALVGYVTNWIAIKLLFEPAEPQQFGPLVLQGLFESRQPEVSEEFGRFMKDRVVSSERLLEALASDGDDGPLYAFLRRQLPHPIPGHVLSAAVKAIKNAANNPKEYSELHAYMTSRLDIEDTLSSRLKLLSPTDFEDLLHPVFQEDEMTLIVVGGVLGAMAGGMQTRLGWGGPAAVSRLRAIVTLLAVSASSAMFFISKEKEILEDEIGNPEEVPVVVIPNLVRRNTLVRTTP